jgi:hypothetical protein
VTEAQGPPLARGEAHEASDLGPRERQGGGRGYLWWALLVLPLWAVFLLCTRWEPVMGDGWRHLWWHRDNTLGLSTIYDFSKEIYLYENPRLGQLLTMLVYTRGPYHMIVTPLVELGVFATLTAIALGRWPSVRRSEDAFVAAILTATIVSCAPQIGPMLFYRPFTGNYMFGLALNLWWLVPYRLDLAAPRTARIWLAPPMLVLGLAAGLSNEHTGLAFLAMGGLASVVALRRGSLRIWMVAGLLGLAAGYWLLLTAPGQHVRYQALAEQAGIFARITGRGVLGNLRVIGVLALAVLPSLPLVGIALLERRAVGPMPPARRWTYAVLALAGFACTLTLLASPKIGPRLYFASVALIAAGLTGWLTETLHRTWARRTCASLAAGALVFVAVRLVAIHRVVGPIGVDRLERIAHGAPGSVLTVPRYPYGGNRYFLGDDFRFPERREAVAIRYGLKAIELEAPPVTGDR